MEFLWAEGEKNIRTSQWRHFACFLLSSESANTYESNDSVEFTFEDAHRDDLLLFFRNVKSLKFLRSSTSFSKSAVNLMFTMSDCFRGKSEDTKKTENTWKTEFYFRKFIQL